MVMPGSGGGDGTAGTVAQEAAPNKLWRFISSTGDRLWAVPISRRTAVAASAAGDFTDVVATAAGRRRLPPGSTPATVAVGGGSALVSLLLAGAVEK
jgi:hypothetical protein